MKTKQLIIAAIIVMASIATSGCKKDSSVAPTKKQSTIKLSTIDSTNLSGGGDGPVKH
ncbi:hypothetical protein [Mucilaginibacter sp. OK098]|uniref:hypothetical protein n=1 Tax=Mucilaginibacter sp. OK098 TaxID=1855297 RepID=UPI000913F92E|nr:hypothetical protein [Mucilaginibacter sp. OK098]SHM57500.1 hypothetical protein SAMN05216524_102566 [Mucilaginibacter sp. OK098]